MKKELWAIAAYVILLSLYCGAIWHEEKEISEYREALQYNAKMKILYRDSLRMAKRQYDSVVSIKQNISNIYNSDVNFKSYPNRVIKGSGIPLVFTIDSPIIGYLSQKDWQTLNKQKAIKH